MEEKKENSAWEKWFQYSKIIVFVTGAIFFITLFFCLTRDFENVYDATVYVTAVTVTGGVFGSAIIWYEKKAQAENVSKIQIQHVKDTAEIEFNIYERKVRLQKELGILGKPDIGMDEENMMHADESLNNAITRDQNYLESKMDDSVSDPEMQAYG